MFLLSQSHISQDIMNHENNFFEKGLERKIKVAYSFIVEKVFSIKNKRLHIIFKRRKMNRDLINASKRGNTALVQELIMDGANINARGEGGWTGLIWATLGGHFDTVRTLLIRGADANAKTKNGCSALIWAAALGYRDIVKLLLSDGANVDVKNKKGWTALIAAKTYKHEDIIEILGE